LYSVISVQIESLPANTKMSGIDPFVDGQSVKSPFLGGQVAELYILVCEKRPIYLKRDLEKRRMYVKRDPYTGPMGMMLQQIWTGDDHSVLALDAHGTLFQRTFSGDALWYICV